jgi:hypothetical protein
MILPPLLVRASHECQNDQHTDYFGIAAGTVARRHTQLEFVMDGSNPQLEAKSMVEAGDVSLFWLWLQYWSLGGSADEIELEAFIAGIPLLQGFEVDVLAATLQDLTAQ